MKQWFSAKELADRKLPHLPTTKSGLIRYATKREWESQIAIGVGGESHEYHISNLPAEARAALEAQLARELLTRVDEIRPAQLPVSLSQTGLTERERSTADARAAIINTITAMCAQGITQAAAMTTLLTQAETGDLVHSNPVLDQALRLAKDSRGRGNSPYPSVRSLKRYLAKDAKTLAPKRREPLPPPTWANDFLSCWQRPEKPSVEHAYREFLSHWASASPAPSIYAVRRFLKKMGTVAKAHGRMGHKELKTLKPFVRRDFDKLAPGDIYSADGHTFDAEVQHPLHGRPFRPEVTTWIDIATRKAVGVSVALAESGVAVLDALIDGCTHAVPAVIYVDNGSGYRNAMLKDEATGILARLGSTMLHSLPYNSQARGVIERVHQTLWIDGAKSLPGFMGVDMDREALHQQFKLSRQALRGGRQTLMPWDRFMAWVQQRVEWYNDRPHASLPKITDITGKRRHLSPNEVWQQHIENGWQPLTLSTDEAAQIFRPRTTRIVQRGEITLFANRYFSNLLEEWHGEPVHVAYDLNHAERIWLFEPETGRYIGPAEWHANHIDYMPMSVVEQGRERRAKARLHRIDVKRQEILEERNGQPLMEGDTLNLGGIGTITGDMLKRHQMQTHPAEPELVPLSKFERMTPAERWELHCAYTQGTRSIPPEDEYWVESYARTKEYSAFKRREEEAKEIQFEKTGTGDSRPYASTITGRSQK